MTCCASDMGSSDLVDAQCKEIYQGVSTGPCHLGVTINTVREFVIKKEGKNQGKKMAFLSVSDNTAILDSVIMFPDSYEKYKRLLYENNTVILFGQPSKEKNGGFIVDKVYQI
jgi:DNA polymerase III alpha subunit